MSGASPGRDRWVMSSVGVLIGLIVVAVVAGFVWLPMLPAGGGFASAWDAICSAAGFFYPAPNKQPVVEANYPTTRVVLGPELLRGSDADSVGRGATLALNCSMCHGARGISQADSPNLAGQYPISIYKQLQDFKSGARASAVMQPLVAGLSEQDMRDLAAFYAYLPRPTSGDSAGAPEIVLSGAPMRNVAPCGACHGELDHKAGSPWLEGEPAAYIAAQLRAFASGARRNDIDGAMRNVARQMTPAEIDAAAAYYAGHR
jgi:cytochrome c553